MADSKTILILGAGVGGVATARALRRRLPANHRVVLVDRERDYVFPPSLLWLMVGRRRADAITRPLARLARKGIDVRVGSVEHIDPDERIVRVSGEPLVVAHAIAHEQQSARFNGHGECFIEVGDGKTGFGGGDFYAEPKPAITLRPPSWWWHLGKVWVEKSWLYTKLCAAACISTARTPWVPQRSSCPRVSLYGASVVHTGPWHTLGETSRNSRKSGSTIAGVGLSTLCDGAR